MNDEAQFVERIFADVVPVRRDSVRTATVLRIGDLEYTISMATARVDAVRELVGALDASIAALGRRVAALESARRRRDARAARR